jgi:hypothetical protein
MPKFSNQFQRHDPFEFRPDILIATWPHLILKDARSLLKEKTSEELEELALAIEWHIDFYAQQPDLLASEDSWIWTRVEREWVGLNPTFSADEARDAFGDLNIFIASGEKIDQSPRFMWQSTAKDWELFAVLAIWKLIDARDVLYGHASDSLTQKLQVKSEFRHMKSTALAMEAQAACSIALQRRERTIYVEQQKQFVRDDEARRRSSNSSHAATTLHMKRERNRCREDIAANAPVDC